MGCGKADAYGASIPLMLHMELMRNKILTVASVCSGNGKLGNIRTLKADWVCLHGDEKMHNHGECKVEADR